VLVARVNIANSYYYSNFVEVAVVLELIDWLIDWLINRYDVKNNYFSRQLRRSEFYCSSFQCSLVSNATDITSSQLPSTRLLMARNNQQEKMWTDAVAELSAIGRNR